MPRPNQLRLFHPVSYESLPVEGERIIMEARPQRSWTLYNWRCMECGQRGMCVSWPRQDLLDWAIENHTCRQSHEQYVITTTASSDLAIAPGTSPNAETKDDVGKIEAAQPQHIL